MTGTRTLHKVLGKVFSILVLVSLVFPVSDFALSPSAVQAQQVTEANTIYTLFTANAADKKSITWDKTLMYTDELTTTLVNDEILAVSYPPGIPNDGDPVSYFGLDALAKYILPFGDNYPTDNSSTPRRITQSGDEGDTHQCPSSSSQPNCGAIDFGLPNGTPIYAVYDGVIRKVAWDSAGFGNYILLEHDGSSTYSLYAHLQNNSTRVIESQRVKQGQLLALSSNTGGDWPYHLHFGIALKLRIQGEPEDKDYVYTPVNLEDYPGLIWLNPSDPDECDGENCGNARGVPEVFADRDVTGYSQAFGVGYFDLLSQPIGDNNIESLRVPDGFTLRLSKERFSSYDNTYVDIVGPRVIRNLDWTGVKGNEASVIEVFKTDACASVVLSGIFSSKNPNSDSSGDFCPLPSFDGTDNAAFTYVESPGDDYVAIPNQTIQKTWQVRNTGSTTWGSGYQLTFVSGEQMGATSAVNIPATAPGQIVNISVDIIAPNAPGAHRGYWKLRNPQGTYFGDILWVQVNIPDETGAPTPPSGVAIDLDCTNCLATVSPGQTFRPTIRATVNEGQILESRGDMLRHKSGDLFGAWPHVAVQGAVNQGQSYDFTFYADNPIHAPAQEGTYESKWQVWRNGNWAGEEYTLRFTVSQSGGNNRPPNRPTLTGPGDWAVYQGTQVVLTAQHNGDPDGDAVSEYYFDIFESAQNANSGWISSNTWSPTGLGFNGYQWRVKVRDNHGNESDWSEQVWHFNILNNDPEIYNFHSETCRESWGGAEKLCFCAQTNAGTLKLMVNMASDGSDNGEWRVLNELGTPNYNCSTDDDRPPNWGQLEGASGDHLVRLYARREGGWANAAHRDITVHLPAERRPNWPPLRLPLNRSYVDSQTVHFDWEESLRTTTYRLEVSDISDFSNLLIEQTFPYGTTEYDYTFSTDYETLYWRVIGIGPYGTNQSDWRFHIDVTPPESSISTLPPVTTDTKFTVNWSGHDARSGVRWYHVQMRDVSHPDSAWEDWLVNTTKTAELFQGQPGHSYAFRVRSMDEIGNWEDWPADTLHGDAYTRVDPSAAPPTAWWNDSYAHKRNLVILNNDSDTIPVGFSMPLHFDATTTPTAAEIYNTSLAANKGDDVRIVYNNATELHRFVQRFTSTAIDIWFPLQAGLGGGATNTGDYQIYYGNAGANNPPANVNDVFLPKADGNTMGLWHFQEGSGSSVSDTSGRSHNGNFTSAAWADGFMGYAGSFNGSDAYVDMGDHNDFDVTAMTLEAWVYLAEASGNYPHVISKWGDTGRSYFLRINGGRNIEFQIKGDGGDRDVVSGEQLELNQWYHIAGVHDGGNNMWVYINGVERGHNGDSRTPYSTSTGLHIGRDPTWDGTAFPGYIQHVRVSNTARHDFPYAKVDIPPAVEAGIPINPPSSGTADLALTGLTTYPSLEGGLLVVAAVENQGDAATQNNFYTDLYVDHLPTGSGDFSGSLQFWVNAPIAAGATVTLTTVLTETGAMQQQAALSGAPAEVELTLYAQVDSTGVIGETDDQNNITGAGVEVCLASADAYEGDDSAATATLVAINTTQPRNFDSLSDQDWIKFQTQEGVTYTLRTTSLGIGADTYLYLYDTDQTTLLAANDDYAGTLASQISWVAPRDDTFYVLVRHWNPNVGGCGTRYTLSVSDRPSVYTIYLPLILRNYVYTAPVPTPTLTPSSTATPVPTATPSPTETPVPDYTWQQLGHADFSPRGGAAIGYDEHRQKIVIYGGSCIDHACSDTWEYDTLTGGWQQISATGPLNREDARMVYDSANQKMILFGGHRWAREFLQDTWEYDGSSWTQITTEHAPPGRSAQGMAYDAARGKVVIFGGWADMDGAVHGDTWEYDGTDWEQVLTAHTPPERTGTTLVYVPEWNKTVLFTGEHSTWTYDGQDWTQITTTQSPITNGYYHMAYVPELQRVVLFGGSFVAEDNSITQLDDTWEFDGADWQLVTPSQVPSVWSGGGTVYYPNLQGMVVMGGTHIRQNVWTKDMWVYAPED